MAIATGLVLFLMMYGNIFMCKSAMVSLRLRCLNKEEEMEEEERGGGGGRGYNH